jgi:hypothetical protein
MNIVTAHKLEKYIIKLVKNQKPWLQDLFNSEQVAFHLGERDEFTLLVHPKLDDELKTRIQLEIGKYLDKHPSPVIMASELIN